VLQAGAAALATVLALSACGSRSDDDDAGASDAGGATKVAKVGFIGPTTGALSALGLGMRNSAQLAVDQANASNAIDGWRLEFAPEDDQATPDVGKNAATKLASDEEVVGVVGTLNSSVAQQVQPILAAANVIQVSPANTNPSLTKGADLDNPQRPYPTYFRTATTDAVQGPFAARFVYNDLGFKQVATVHDKKTYGQGLVDAFTTEFKALGGEIVAAETINPDEEQFSTVITKVKAAKPQLVYYGGEYPQAGPLSAQMTSAGLDVPLMGGDGIVSGEFPKLAGEDQGDGDFGTSVGAPPEDLPSAADFLAAYEKAGFDDPYEAYGPYSFDAAQAIIAALKECLPGADSVEAARPACVEAMNDVAFDGASGKVAFDEFGDTTTRVLTVYKVQDGAWVAVKTDEFN
jgi:branched-chain amino acid transport system substrate-binding protein